MRAGVAPLGNGLAGTLIKGATTLLAQISLFILILAFILYPFST